MIPARIVIFAKAPVPGKVKTRLVPALGATGAAELAAQMLSATVEEARAAGMAAVELCVDPEPDHPEWHGHIPPDLELSSQGPGDLGDRLARAARRVIAAGEAALLIGTDCPGLDRRRLAAAAASLAAADAFIHPTEDGGYALLGLTRFDDSLFTDIAWSGPTVTATTLERLRALGWSVRVGERLRDIDEPADLL